MSTPHPAVTASAVWRQVFDECPHTSLRIIEQLRVHLGLQYVDILSHPELLQRFNRNTVDTISPGWRHIWSSSTGRCTSFALKIVDILEQQRPGVYRFSFFNINGHRVARCENTGVLIDSTSSDGAPVLPENVDWSTPEGLRGCWKYHHQTGLSFERATTSGTQTALVSPIYRGVAMGICTQEIADKAVMICMFRRNNPVEWDQENPELVLKWKPAYYGLIRWNIPEKQIELFPDVRNRDFKLLVKFGGGNQRSQLDCVIQFERFISMYGIPLQWRADQIDVINRGFWEAATVLWGEPVWRVIGTPPS